jgi:hypothetical protein
LGAELRVPAECPQPGAKAIQLEVGPILLAMAAVQSLTRLKNIVSVQFFTDASFGDGTRDYFSPLINDFGYP